MNAIPGLGCAGVTRLRARTVKKEDEKLVKFKSLGKIQEITK